MFIYTYRLYGYERTEEPGSAARLTFGVAVAERRGAHVAQPDGALAAAVHEHVAVVRVELGRRDHFCQLLHVRRLDIYNIWEGFCKGTNMARSNRFQQTTIRKRYKYHVEKQGKILISAMYNLYKVI